jgi:hypothetical protein
MSSAIVLSPKGTPEAALEVAHRPYRKSFYSKHFSLILKKDYFLFIIFIFFVFLYFIFFSFRFFIPLSLVLSFSTIGV